MASPAAPRSRTGNAVTARRWCRILRGLGHRVHVVADRPPDGGDLLIALHARRSAGAIERFRRQRPEAPLVVTLTGTDLYGDLPQSARARLSLEQATRVVVLQPAALAVLPRHVQAKARVIYQSAAAPARRSRPSTRHFDVAVIAHLRPVKDPFRAELASRGLPAGSRLRVLHAGAPLERRMAADARRRMAGNPRYRWLGDVPGWKARRLIARSRAVVLSSHMEGGANVVSEAVVAGVPLLASRIPGTVGLLGAGYPGYFPVGDTGALRDLLTRTEEDGRFLASLSRWCRSRRGLFAPARERRSWKVLLDELAGAPGPSARGAS